jgi:hypothetical protein
MAAMIRGSTFPAFEVQRLVDHLTGYYPPSPNLPLTIALCLTIAVECWEEVLRSTFSPGVVQQSKSSMRGKS